MDIKRYPNMPVRSIRRYANHGAAAFKEGKLFGEVYRTRATASEINDFLRDRVPADDYERGFFEGLRG